MQINVELNTVAKRALVCGVSLILVALFFTILPEHCVKCPPDDVTLLDVMKFVVVVSCTGGGIICGIVALTQFISEGK